MECNFCKNTFSTKSALNAHQEKTKYCLKIQGKSIKGEYVCQYCERDYVIKHHLTNHLKICKCNNKYTKKIYKELQDEKVKKIALKKTIVSLREKVMDLQKEKEKLQQQYQDLAKLGVGKSTVTNNNFVQNMAVFDKTQEEIEKTVDEKYDKNYLMQGQKGVARFTSTHLLQPVDGKPVYVITDHSRGNGKYKVSETEVVSDPGMSGLTKKIYPSIKAKATELSKEDMEEFFSNQELFDGYQEILNMEEDNSEFRRFVIVRVK